MKINNFSTSLRVSPPLRKFLGLSTVVLALSLTTSAIHAQVYNSGIDFSGAQIGSNVWSYSCTEDSSGAFSTLNQWASTIATVSGKGLVGNINLLPPSSYNLVAVNNVNAAGNFISGSDARIIGGIKEGYVEASYAFICWQTNNSQLQAIRYVPSGNSLLASPAHTLPKSIKGFAVARTVSLSSSSPLSDTVFLFGGYGGNQTFFNEYFSYSATTGFVSMGSMQGSARAGMTAVGIGANKILVFGGYDGPNNSSMRRETYEVDMTNPSLPIWTQKGNMPVALKNAKALPSGANGAVSWVYVVSGGLSTGTDTDNRNVYRYNVGSGTWCIIRDANNNNLVIPGTANKPMEMLSLGSICVLTQSDNGQSMVLYNITHPSQPEIPVVESGVTINIAKGSILTTAKTFTLPTRSRDNFGLIQSNRETWLIGGASGHGSTLQNRSAFVDKLTTIRLGPVGPAPQGPKIKIF
jgi:hypothetical protein